MARASSSNQLTRLNLPSVLKLERAEHFPSELSGGQEQRVAVARALMVTPKLILTDEPTGNLDTETGERILDLLDEAHAGGATLLTVTHSSSVAARAERIVRVVDGQVSCDL